MDSYYQRSQRHHFEHRRHHFYWRTLFVIVILVYIGYCLFRPLPAISLIQKPPGPISQSSVSLPWPSGSEGAIGTLGGGVLASSGSGQKALPTASIAKLITALTVLNKFPLAATQQGPTLTMSEADVNLYNKYYAENGSVVKVTAGEKISEHQALEAMLLPSGNNMADSLAIWAYGSLAEYRLAAQNEVNSLGLKQTTIGDDASGFDPGTVSTPNDLIKLGQSVLGNPLLKQIVSEKTATVPVAGEVKNTNYTLGNGGMIGIKTGNTDEAGGNFLFASNDQINPTHQITIIGVIMHAGSVSQAMDASIPLINAAKTYFTFKPVIKAGQAVASFEAPWLSPIPANAQHDLSIAVWQGHQPPRKMATQTFSPPSLLKPGHTIAAGTRVGQITVGDGNNSSTTGIIASRPVPPPSIFWRVFHPF